MVEIPSAVPDIGKRTPRPLLGRRVCILVQNLPVPFDRRVWQESLALRDAGAQVSVICPGSDGFPVGDFELDGVTIRRFEMPAEASGALGYVREYGISLWRMHKELSRLKGIPHSTLFIFVIRRTCWLL